MYSPKWKQLMEKQFSRIIHLLIIFVNGMRYIVNIQQVFNYKDALLTPKMLIFYQSKKTPVDIIYIINEFCLDRPNKLFNEKWYYAVSQKNLTILGISNYLYNRKNSSIYTKN